MLGQVHEHKKIQIQNIKTIPSYLETSPREAVNG